MIPGYILRLLHMWGLYQWIPFFFFYIFSNWQVHKPLLSFFEIAPEVFPPFFLYSPAMSCPSWRVLEMQEPSWMTTPAVLESCSMSTFDSELSNLLGSLQLPRVFGWAQVEQCWELTQQPPPLHCPYHQGGKRLSLHPCFGFFFVLCFLWKGTDLSSQDEC